MKDRELYGIDLPVIVNGLYPMAVRVPGWVNFGILQHSANLFLLNELARS